jgi:Putative transposase
VPDFHRLGLLAQVPRSVWRRAWVVHCKAAGQGDEALQYLARYVFRGALSNSRQQSLIR